MGTVGFVSENIQHCLCREVFILYRDDFLDLHRGVLRKSQFVYSELPIRNNFDVIPTRLAVVFGEVHIFVRIPQKIYVLASVRFVGHAERSLGDIAVSVHLLLGPREHQMIQLMQHERVFAPTLDLELEPVLFAFVESQFEAADLKPVFKLTHLVAFEVLTKVFIREPEFPIVPHFPAERGG